VFVFSNDAGVTAVAFAADGEHFAVGLDDGSLWLWETRVAGSRRVLQSHRDWVTSIAFSPDGAALASGSRDGQAQLQALQGEGVVSLSDHSGTVTAVCFSPGGEFLASGAEDGTVLLYSIPDRGWLKP
jgi:WD40 repeat protein